MASSSGQFEMDPRWRRTVQEQRIQLRMHTQKLFAVERQIAELVAQLETTIALFQEVKAAVGDIRTEQYVVYHCLGEMD